jgi:hypothetical protein
VNKFDSRLTFYEEKYVDTLMEKYKYLECFYKEKMTEEVKDLDKDHRRSMNILKKFFTKRNIVCEAIKEDDISLKYDENGEIRKNPLKS